jgi:peptide/nickel transport system permease protein
MTKGQNGTVNFTEAPPRVSGFRRIINTFFNRKIVVVGLIIILISVITAIFAPLLAPYHPNIPDLDNMLSGPTKTHPLGTDSLGRDTLSRVIFGTRTSLLVAVSTIGLAAIVGMSMGLIAGYFGGITYIIIMRFTDALMSFPMIVLALSIAALLGGGLRNIVIALGVGMVSIYTRLMCGQVLTVKQNEYILSVRAEGASDQRIMLSHILPNCIPPLIVVLTLMMGSVILAEAGLSFLGIGIEPPGASWGAMVSDGYNYILSNPLLSFAPGIAIMLVVFGFNMVGDGLRDALDPRLRGLL